MISWMRDRINKEEGFTLVELMVVVLIIAILIAIAIPTFLGARERAQDRAAQSNLRNALTSAKVHYTDEEAYTTSGAVTTILFGDLAAIEPSLNFVAAGNAAIADPPNTVHFLAEDNTVVGDFQVITFYNISASGTTFCLKDVANNPGAGTFYDSDATGGVVVYNDLNCAGTEW